MIWWLNLFLILWAVVFWVQDIDRREQHREEERRRRLIKEMAGLLERR